MESPKQQYKTEYNRIINEIEDIVDYTSCKKEEINKTLPLDNFLVYSDWSEEHLNSLYILENIRTDKIAKCDINYYFESVKDLNIKTLPYLRYNGKEYKGKKEVINCLHSMFREEMLSF